MTDSLSSFLSKGKKKRLPVVTLLAAVFVVVLALAAVFFPGNDRYDMQGVFLVLGTPGASEEQTQLFSAMADFLEETSGHTMSLVVVETNEDFNKVARQGVDFALCPDGVALNLPHGQYSSLVAGRRKLPSNLRPRGVMVFRRGISYDVQPWLNVPRRTVFGDSLSLVAVGGAGPMAQRRQCAYGHDPYDHSSTLHALRLGAYDYALVRQWDVNLMIANGLLEREAWEIKEVTIPVPDIVILASEKIPLVDRMKWAESMALVGRYGGSSAGAAGSMVSQLDKLGLVGFNLLLEPDFELVRRKFQGNWPGGVD